MKHDESTTAMTLLSPQTAKQMGPKQQKKSLKIYIYDFMNLLEGGKGGWGREGGEGTEGGWGERVGRGRHIRF